MHGQLVRQLNAHQGRLKSRRPFVAAASKLLDSLSELNIRVKHWTKHKWNADYLESSSRAHAFIVEGIVEPGEEISFFDQVDFVKSFCYLGDVLKASGGSEAAATARTRIG